MRPVRAPDVLALRDGADRAGRGADVVGDVAVQRLHVRHRLRLVLVEAEDLRRDEDVAATGLHRVRQDELALPRRVEQVIPRRRQLAADFLREPVGARDEAEDPRVPTGPEAGRVLELGLELGRVRRDVVLEETGLAQRVVELARAADEDVRLRRRLLGGDARLQVARGREGERVDERVVRGLVERGVDDDVAGGLCNGRRRGRCLGRRCRARRDRRPGSAAARGERRRGRAEPHHLQEFATVVRGRGNVFQLDPPYLYAKPFASIDPPMLATWSTSRSSPRSLPARSSAFAKGSSSRSSYRQAV